MNQKPLIIVISGPQSSGKTTLLNHLQEKFPKVKFLPEINQYNIISAKHLGAAFVTQDVERKIIEKDIAITKQESKKYSLMIIETGIMHLPYAEICINNKVAASYFNVYKKLYDRMNTHIILIDTKPAVSWKRRKSKYLKRIKHIKDPKLKQTLFDKYHRRIFDFYPVWKKYTKLLPYKKYIINDSYITKTKFLKKSIQIVSNILTDCGH